MIFFVVLDRINYVVNEQSAVSYRISVCIAEVESMTFSRGEEFPHVTPFLHNHLYILSLYKPAKRSKFLLIKINVIFKYHHRRHHHLSFILFYIN